MLLKTCNKAVIGEAEVEVEYSMQR